MIKLERPEGDQLKLSVDVAEYREWRHDVADSNDEPPMGPLDSIAYWMEDHGFTLTTADAGDHKEWVLRDDFLDDDDPRWLAGEEPVYGVTHEQAAALEVHGSIVLSRWRAV